MQNNGYKLVRIKSKRDIPFNLLLIADETIEAIEKYIYDSDIYILNNEKQSETIAVFALYEINENEIEIKNIAVSENFQGKGIGSYLINEIIKIVRNDNFKKIIVGTADTGVEQIKFYEKNGFVKYSVKKDFFIENYPEPIFEDGIMLKDMIMLKLNI
jgi:ribosomal protein S18 acetylase RimI-like enzyme